MRFKFVPIEHAAHLLSAGRFLKLAAGKANKPDHESLARHDSGLPEVVSGALVVNFKRQSSPAHLPARSQAVGINL